MKDKIEEALDKYDYRCQWELSLNETQSAHARQICSDLIEEICIILESKPDEGLLSWERIRMVFQEQDKKGQHDNMFRMEALCQEQRDLTASIKDAERKDKNSTEVSNAYFRGRQDGLMMKDMECQQRVERILEEIERRFIKLEWKEGWQVQKNKYLEKQEKGK